MSHDGFTAADLGPNSFPRYREYNSEDAEGRCFSLLDPPQDVDIKDKTEDQDLAFLQSLDAGAMGYAECFGIASSQRSLSDAAVQHMSAAFIPPTETSPGQHAIFPLISPAFPYPQPASGSLPCAMSSFRLPVHEQPVHSPELVYTFAESSSDSCASEPPTKRIRQTEPAHSTNVKPEFSEYTFTFPDLSPSTPPVRMSRSARIQHALDVLRAGRISPFDLLTELVDISCTTRTAHYRSKLYSQKNQKLEKLLDMIVEDPSGKVKVEEWIRSRKLGETAGSSSSSSKENTPLVSYPPVQQNYYRFS